jgi:proline dehydrogenase
MTTLYSELVANISKRYGVSIEHIDRRVQSRRAKLRGLLGARMAARTVSLSLALGALEARFGSYIAAGGNHVTGLKETDVIAAAAAEHRAGRLATLGYWANPGEAPASIAAHYVRAIESLVKAGLPSSVSIKADVLGYDTGLVMNVLDAARAGQVRVHFDAQGYDTIDRTHALVEDAVHLGRDVSATLPARLRRSLADAERFVRLGLPLRIVKGQGGDPDHPRIDPQRSFLELADCLAGRAVFVGVATHDRRAAEPALDALVRAGTPCALEQMRSLPRLDFVATARGLPVRVYIAYGYAGLPYAIAELMRRPAIAGWILRDLLVRRAPCIGTHPSDTP